MASETSDHRGIKNHMLHSNEMRFRQAMPERQALGDKYHAQRRIDQINDLVRGIRASINILIKEETALLSERSALQGEGNGK